MADPVADYVVTRKSRYDAATTTLLGAEIQVMRHESVLPDDLDASAARLAGLP